MSGAIAIDLAVKQQNTAGLIVQSFTSMIEQIAQFCPSLKVFLKLIIDRRFNSVEKGVQPTYA